ncbi:MAG: hypothetical protein HAW62_03230 [Endozoicomonadaceae bacterium]|nr:hypothetical protein [Endozoicomonadaceae bacterium]
MRDLFCSPETDSHVMEQAVPMNTQATPVESIDQANMLSRKRSRDDDNNDDAAIFAPIRKRKVIKDLVSEVFVGELFNLMRNHINPTLNILKIINFAQYDSACVLKQEPIQSGEGVTWDQLNALLQQVNHYLDLVLYRLNYLLEQPMLAVQEMLRSNNISIDQLTQTINLISTSIPQIVDYIQKINAGSYVDPICSAFMNSLFR